MIKIILFSLTCLYVVTSCSLKNSHVDVSYQPLTKRLKLATWENISIEVTDRRPLEALGYKKNLIGMKTALILPKENLAASLQDFFEKALPSPLQSHSKHLTLLITINTCFTHCDQKILYKRAVANLSLDVTLANHEGTSTYTKNIEVEGIESPIFSYSEKAIHKALKKAFQLALEATFNERESSPKTS